MKPSQIVSIILAGFAAFLILVVGITVFLTPREQPARRAVIDTSSLSTHEAGHGSASPYTAPGGLARHRGLHYLLIGCPLTGAPERTSAARCVAAAVVMAPVKQYGVSSFRPTLPIDSNFPSTSLHNNVQGRPVEFEHPTPEMAVSAGEGFTT